MKTTRAVGVRVAFILAIIFILHGQTFSGSSYVLPDYGTNLYIAQPKIIAGNLAGILSNTVPDIPYEIKSRTNLSQNDWFSEGFIPGSELTNWTAFSVAKNNRQKLFISALSWQDSTGTGIPDWWWLKYFGQITNVDAYADPDGDGWNNLQEFQNGTSPVAFNAPSKPTGVYAYVDSTGTNVLLSWNPAPAAATNYMIYQGVIDWDTFEYVYHQIGQTAGNGTTFNVVGAIQTYDDYYDVYAVKAVYAGGGTSPLSDYSYTYFSPFSPPTYNYNIYLTACLVRNGAGRWQVMFSGFSTNSAQTIQLTWFDPNWFYNGNNGQIVQNISTSTLTNGIYQISDADMITILVQTNTSLSAQLFGPNGEPGQVVQVGTLPNDAPYFVDGRQHMKQNLNFLIRAASIYQPFGPTSGGSRLNQSATNFEEFSFLYHDTALDNLWPFTANYALANYLVDLSRTNDVQSPIGQTNFNFQPNFATNIPAPPILSHADPFWIVQPGFSAPNYPLYLGGTTTNWGVTLSHSNIVATLQSGLHNLFGLPEQTGCAIDMLFLIDGRYGTYLLDPIYQPLAPGDTITAEYGTNYYYYGQYYYHFAGYASWCPAPTLQFINYYFAPLIRPGQISMGLSPLSQQPFPLPIDDNFNVTNQTPPMMVGTVGQPMILASWAKYSISNSSPAKYAYLGQYFVTNAFLLNTNGVATTNSAGILSPYGEFFPTQAGQAALVTMPDIDPPYQQATGIVRIVSLSVDANHDGVLDFSYFGPDQTSPSRPLRFWVDDSSDSGDYGGTGIPGQGTQGNGVRQIEGQWKIHGRRDLVNLFPVHLNISSLFQSNALSSGISVTDTSYQFVLSHADGALRFTYTDLTPANYMTFLQDTNKSGLLASAPLTTITASGVVLSNSFVNGIATANKGIILVEAWTNTAQPLVLSIYHGTNLISQTSLYLSISGVEQMFRHKNLLLNSDPGAGADRLTDADVPNEPDTIEKNVVFVHGYNVNTNQARGWFADIYKRLYWSGSHARFYGVTWRGYDTQIGTTTPNYQVNVVHAFQTAPNLANFIGTLTNGPTIVVAHSLGNMVVLSALSDWNAPISQYFMVDAAVAMEAIDPNTAADTNMIHPEWEDPTNAYAVFLRADGWHTLFPTNDARSTLSWNGRLANFGGTEVYNFYSSGEEVLRTFSGAPPDSLFSVVYDEVKQYLDGRSGTFAWAWQEKCKGRMFFNSILSSSHGGWGFNSSYDIFPGGMRTHLPASRAATNTVAQLQAVPFFDNSFDAAMYTTNSSGITYAQTNRDRILSDAIPALTLPIGANPVPDAGIVALNFDMQLNQNGWPPGRLQQLEKVNWYHSDIRIVAYTFTYKVFNQMVSVGNLK